MPNFKTRARAIDMLGRQQIAGTQNAINEIFKNAHDAYAKSAQIDLFEKDQSLLIRDNGVGMTREDFEGKWLVLGTESKVGKNKLQQFRPSGMKARTIVGEKGIGRLAIALLGAQVLVLTRAIRDDGLHDLVMGLVHWGLFEVPGLNLDEIDIPIATITGGQLPTAQQIDELKEALIQCSNNLAEKHADRSSTFKDIIKQIKAFTPDPVDLEQFVKQRETDPLLLSGENTGTHFVIAPVNPVLPIEISLEEDKQDYSFRSQLLGFADHVFGTKDGPDISTSLRKWSAAAVAGEELLDVDTFFTKEDLIKRTDHYLRGNVDEFGHFTGSLRVYDKEYSDITIASPEVGIKTECGSFEVVFGYLMGRQSESLIAGDDYKELNDKLETIGGLYVYRDGIRVLPYGDVSFDWLEIEKRRSKGAGYYFFSYRRIFGAVLLTAKDNTRLQEKAGREGFQQNKAYRQFRNILSNLLIQLAAEFFRKDTEKGELFEKTQLEIRKRAEALARQQKQSSEKRRRFGKALESFSKDITAGLPEKAAEDLRAFTRSQMEAASKIDNPDKAASELIKAEQEAMASLNVLKERFTRKRPAGVALTKELSRDWEGYIIEKARLESRLFDPLEEDIAQTLGKVARQARLYINQKKRLQERIRALAADRKKQLQAVVTQTEATASETRKSVLDITQKAMVALESTIEQIEDELKATDFDSLTPQKIEALRKAWENKLTDIESRHRDALIAARDMLASLAENLRVSEGEEPAQIMEALEQRMLALEEEADQNFELVQMGLAVAIINHEFAAAIKNVRRNIRELGQISQKSASIRPLYTSIRSSFEHLDGHLKLFTPLQRRLYRSAIEISGKSIRNYVTDLFDDRIARHNVQVECTPAFLRAKIECYPSTLYPSLINLVDNALFWLTKTPGERKLRFDVSGHDLVIANNGPQIEERDRERIFERGFTRKPGGGGLGVFISARALSAEKMQLTVGTPPAGFSVAFHINAPTLSLESR